MIDNKTDFLQLPLPNKDNELNQDIFRIIESFNSLDQFLKEKFSSIITDWNIATSSGFYVSHEAINAPEPEQSFLGLVINEQNSLIQILYSLSAPKIFWRTCSGNNFPEWLTLPSSISSELASNSNSVAVSTALLTQVVKSMRDIIEYNFQTMEQRFIDINLSVDTVAPKVASMLFSYADLLDGYLLCNGATISRTTYSALFSVIGTKFGGGDGSTSFKLPDTRGRVLQGANGNSGNYINAGLPNIHGSLGAWTRPDLDPVSGAFSNTHILDNITNTYVSTSKSIRVVFNAASSNNIYGGSVTVQPPALLLNCFIKY